MNKLSKQHPNHKDKQEIKEAILEVINYLELKQQIEKINTKLIWIWISVNMLLLVLEILKWRV